MKIDGRLDKPKKRGIFRKIIGRELYILKRKLIWISQRKIFAKPDNSVTLNNSLIRHKSILIRPLKNVQMYLQYNKTVNLNLAIKHIDYLVIKPGQVFSFWRLVGRPTKSKGYLEGLSIVNGQVSKDTGGGLCQLGNLLFWMTLHTPLKIRERWRHCYDVFPDLNRTIPFGCGASLGYNFIDLQFQNDTDATFQYRIWMDKKYLNGEITSDKNFSLKYEIFETDHQIKHHWWKGYTRHNKIWKKITNLKDNSETVEFVTENNALMMYDPLLEYNHQNS